MKTKIILSLAKLICLSLLLSISVSSLSAAVTATSMTVQVFPEVRKPLKLAFTGASGSTYTTALTLAPTKGRVEYFDSATSTYRVLVVGTPVTATTWYYTSNAGFSTTDSFGWKVTETTTGGVVSSATKGCLITAKPILYPNDWPMYRQEHHHRGETAMSLPSNLYLQWVREFPAITSAWTAESRARFDTGYRPVVAGKTLYVGSNRNDCLIALNTDTGAERWKFFTDGPIRFAPIAVNGKVYVGSDDGYVYCLDGATSAVIWKFRGGPSERRVFGNERMISTWPVRGAPVYYNGKIYFACGLWPWEGIFVYALNSDTGAIVWKNDGGGNETPIQPHSGWAVSGISPQGQCVIKNTLDKLIVPNGHALPAFFDLTTGKLDTWEQRGSLKDGSCFADANGKPIIYPVLISAGSQTYTTGPGVVGTVHNLIAADNKLFVTTTQGKIYCFGGTSIASPTTWTTNTTPLPTVTDTWTSAAAQMISQVGLGEGHAMVWGIGTGRLVEELAKQSQFKIDVYDPDSIKVNALRQKLEAAGLYGTRIAVHTGSPMSIDFPPYTARLVASEDATAAGITSDPAFAVKLFKVIRPYGGTAWLSLSSAQHTTFTTAVDSLGSSQAAVSRNGNFSLLARNGRLPGTTDFVETPAEFEKSQDQLVKPPFAAQWYSDKYIFGGNHSTYPHPDVIDGYMVDHLGRAYDVYTGLKLTITRPYSGAAKEVLANGYQTVGTRTNPFHGKTEDRMYFKGYGCAATRIFGDILTFRSGNAAYYHLPSESGPVNIGGMRAGCVDYAQIPANGVFINSSQSDCSCEYPIRTALGMVHRPDGEQFTGWQEKTPLPIDDDPIRKLGINFGAPGDRMASDRTLWIHKPAKINNTPFIPTQIEPAASIESYVHHTSFIKGGNSPTWVAASGIKGVTSIKANLVYPNVTALTGTPVIDGNLSDSCWNGSAPIELYDPAYREAVNAKLQGLVYMRYDANKMYFAFNYWGSNPATLGKPASWDLFITDRLKYNQKYAHYRVDYLGVTRDAIRIFPAAEDETWSDAGWTSAYTTTTTNFIVEMAIPWSSITNMGLDRNTLAINVQGPKYNGNSDFLQLRAMINRGGVYFWQIGSSTTCTRFCPVGFGTPIGDLGKTRAYTVRMHFAEPDSIAAGQRVFDIGLQGSTVASNFDIVAQAGGAQKSVIKEFTNVQIKDYLNISFTPRTGVPVISGLEVFENGVVTIDSIAPSVPTGLVASAASSSQINLSWTASTDNVGVVGYKVYRNGTEVGSSSIPSYSDTGLSASTTYNYKIAAIDAAGNLSAQSIQVSAATSASGDSILPTVAISAPLAGTTVSGTATLSANASDNVAVVGVQFKVDGVNVGAEDTTSPYSISWNTTSVANGSHSITAVARDAAGNSKVSTAVSVTVNNVTSDTTPPTITMTSPVSGSTVSGNITVSASASDNVGVVGVQFKVDGINLGAEDMASPYSMVLNTATLTPGSHSITAVARDAAGNSKIATAVTVMVSNVPAAPSGLIATFGTATQVNLSWSDNSSNETGFRIERKTGASGTYASLASVGVGVTSYSDSTIVSGIQYFYRVCATSSAGNSPYSNETSPSSSVIVAALGGGLYHSVAVKSDGTVWGWGGNQYGQLGNGTTNSSLTPKQVSSLSGMMEISSGEKHVLSLKSDGTVWSWGYNTTSQLGDGTASQRLTPVIVSGLGNVQSIEAGADHSLALKSDGTLWAWGKNSSGQIGNGTNTTQKLPLKVSLPAPVIDMVGGNTYSAALLQDGTVWTWGSNDFGQLGNGTIVSSMLPVKVTGLSNVVKITGGRRNVLALKSDGTVWGWGENGSGQVGAGNPLIVGSSLKLPIQIAGLGNNVIEIASSGDHSLALKSDGTIWSWGYNSAGQLGNGTTVKGYVPAAVMLPAGGYVGIHAGTAHSLALKADGSLYTWGSNTYGQLGDGTVQQRLLPVKVSTLDLIVP